MSYLADLYTMAHKAQADMGLTALAPNAPRLNRNPLLNAYAGWALRRQADRLHKSIGQALLAAPDMPEAKEQGSVVNDSLRVSGFYETNAGIRDVTGATFGVLRQFAHHCEPAAAIIERRVAQVSAFAEPAGNQPGRPKKPGFKIKLTVPKDAPTEEDQANIERLTQFMAECGSAEPPEEEKPVGWQPGFEAFLSQIARDSLTMDWVTVRRWASKTDPNAAPIVAFAAEDAALIRWVEDQPAKIVDGVVETHPYPAERKNLGGERVVLAKVDNPDGSGTKVEEYSRDEMATFVRNPRTDTRARGYGYSELERGINAVSAWLYARDYNISRFRKDTLPRGVLAILGNVDQVQFDMFELRWREMMQSGRWVTPILRGQNTQNAGVQWIPIDQSSREMEYHQFMFSVALWLHSLYGIHPEETGYEALSPFRPPLSEGSPQAKLEYSQDSGLTPFLRKLQSFINRSILWQLVPDRRYTFEFVGVGEYDEMAEVELWSARLQAGMTTPRLVWNATDQTIPEPIKDHPAWDLPMIFSEGIQLLITMEQAEMQKQEMEQQSQMAQEQQVQASAQQQAALSMPGGQGGPQAGPPGMSQGPPGMSGPPGGAPGGTPGGSPSFGAQPGQGQPVRASDQQMSATFGKAVRVVVAQRSKQRQEALRRIIFTIGKK